MATYDTYAEHDDVREGQRPFDDEPYDDECLYAASDLDFAEYLEYACEDDYALAGGLASLI